MSVAQRKRSYLRDGRAPVPKNERTSFIMSRIKAKNTKPELELRKLLWKNGLSGYRLHPKDLPGRPDIYYPKRKLAIFVHGCFWHRCPYCKKSYPKTHKTFWKNKFLANIKRDKKKIEILKKREYKVIICWECRIKKNLKYYLKILKVKILT